VHENAQTTDELAWRSIFWELGQLDCGMHGRSGILLLPVHIEAWRIANDGHRIFNALDVEPEERLRFQRKIIPMRQAIPAE